MALLDRAAILAANDLPTRDVDVPEWGGTVRIRAMNARDRGDYETVAFEQSKMGRSIPENFRAHYAAACIVGDDGEPLFTGADVVALGLKSADALQRVFDAIMEMNKIAPAAIEDAAKN